MPNFLIDDTIVVFGGQVFQQTVGIPMGTNCAPLFADLFLYSYEAECLQNLLKKQDTKLAQSFNFTFLYIDDDLSLSNSKFDDCLHLISPSELEIKDTTESPESPHTWIYFLKLAKRETCQQSYTIREVILILQSPTFHSCVATFQHRLHMACIFHNSFVSAEHAVNTEISFIDASY